MVVVRCFYGVVMVLCGCLSVATEAFCWEFNLRSTSTFQYQYFGNDVDHGFFGPTNSDSGNATNGDFAAVNGWLGVQVNNLVSGSDAARSLFTTYLYPELKVNQAIKLEGSFRIGNTDTYTNPGGTVAWANIEALWWAINIQTPMGRINYSKRPFDYGCGFQNDGDNRTEEYFSLTAPYGPFKMGVGIYPWRRAITVENPGVTTIQPYWNTYDKNSTPDWDVFGFLQYTGGPLEVGAGGKFFSYHFGPEGTVTQANRANIPGIEAWSTEGWVWSKYSNGRFFLNAEADWYYRNAVYQPSLSASLGAPAILDDTGALEAENTDGSGSIFRHQYTQWWRYMVELGAMAGPGKVSVLYAYIPGPDRRHGVLIDRQPVLVDLLGPNSDTVIFHPQHSNATVFRAYSILLGAGYGAGLLAQQPGTIPTTPLGYMVDASILAARLDYAVASNLNLYGSFLYANRASQSGWGWGSLGPTETAATATTPATFAMVVQSQRNFTAPFPSIPDSSLGWEINAGADWNLLETLTASVAAGYWQPGKWFSYACVDRSVPGWDQPTSANFWGTNPSRTIAPVIGVNWTMTCSF